MLTDSQGGNALITQEIMDVVKKKIIHWLGGYTRQEEQKAYIEGNRDMCVQIREKAKELNGMDPVDWCNGMWLYLELTRKDCDEKYGRQE